MAGGGAFGTFLRARRERLTPAEDERMHMVSLVSHTVNEPLCPTTVTPSATIAPTVRQLLDGLGRMPAFVTGPQNDVLAWNAAWQAVAAPLGMLDGDPPNIARYVFLHPSAPTVLTDWARAADEQASRLRAASARWGADPGFAALVDELSGASEQFRVRWSSHAVSEKRRGAKRLTHPDAGELRVDYEVLLLADESDQRLTTWLAADAESAAKLTDLLADTEPVSPARLRVVGAD